MSSARPIRTRRTRRDLCRDAAAHQGQGRRLHRTVDLDLGEIPGPRQIGAGALCPGDRLLPHAGLDKALPAIDALIRDYPRDPYFRELKGQMLFENGRIAEAVQPYEEAMRLAPGCAAAAHRAGAGLRRKQRSDAEQARDRLSQAMRCVPKTRTSMPGICSPPPMAATTRSAWRRCPLPRKAIAAGQQELAIQQATARRAPAAGKQRRYARAPANASQGMTSTLRTESGNGACCRLEFPKCCLQSRELCKMMVRARSVILAARLRACRAAIMAPRTRRPITNAPAATASKSRRSSTTT